MISRTIQFIGFIGLLLLLQHCRKIAASPVDSLSPIAEAKSFMEKQPSSLQAPERSLQWDDAKQVVEEVSSSIWVPVKYAKPQYIWHGLDSSRLFNVNYMQSLRLWKDSANNWQEELVTYFPDSNYKSGPIFTGIILVRNWRDDFIAAYKYEKDGKKRRLSQLGGGNRASNTQGLTWIEVCYESHGYNYANQTREIFYWSVDLGCDTYYINGGGDGYNYAAGSQFGDGYSTQGSSGGSTAGDNQWVSNTPIKGAPNAIADIKDYDKCFDNVPGSGHQYSVTICVDQPKPGSRDAWETISSANNDFQFFSVGHTFLILKDVRSNETVTRNVGFYPKGGVSPISPIDAGQLNNDEEHYYNVSLTIPLDNSSFFTILAYVAHGNDQGNQYDLNSNNCTTFVINALNSAGIHIPATTGYWPGGGGYNPGDLGEDIRSMTMTAGMTKSVNEVGHPNTGKCN